MMAQLDLSDRAQPEVMPHLKPLCTAIDMVFGSAAALSATFGFKVLFFASSAQLCNFSPNEKGGLCTWWATYEGRD